MHKPIAVEPIVMAKRHSYQAVTTHCRSILRVAQKSQYLNKNCKGLPGYSTSRLGFSAGSVQWRRGSSDDRYRQFIRNRTMDNYDEYYLHGRTTRCACLSIDNNGLLKAAYVYPMLLWLPASIWYIRFSFCRATQTGSLASRSSVSLHLLFIFVSFVFHISRLFLSLLDPKKIANFKTVHQSVITLNN